MVDWGWGIANMLGSLVGAGVGFQDSTNTRHFGPLWAGRMTGLGKTTLGNLWASRHKDWIVQGRRYGMYVYVCV